MDLSPAHSGALRCRSLPPTTFSTADKTSPYFDKKTSPTTSSSIANTSISSVEKSISPNVDRKSSFLEDVDKISESPNVDKKSPTTRTTYKVSGQLQSWKSGDIKMFLNSEEKENQKTEERFKPKTSIFDENYSTYAESTKVKNEKNSTKNVDNKFERISRFDKSVDNSASVIPTSSQLVKNVEESFKNASKDVGDKDVDIVDMRDKPKKVILQYKSEILLSGNFSLYFSIFHFYMFSLR